MNDIPLSAYGIQDAATAAVRVPPQAIEAEQSLLGSLMLDNGAWDRVCDLVGEKDFYRADRRRIFKAIAQLVDCAMPADALTVADALGDDLGAVGGREYLGHLSINTISAANIRRYAEIVRDRAVRREIIGVCTEAIDRLYSNPEPGLLSRFRKSYSRSQTGTSERPRGRSRRCCLKWWHPSTSGSTGRGARSPGSRPGLWTSTRSPRAFRVGI